MTIVHVKTQRRKKMLKKVDKKKNPGLAKLPKKVRNKMGYMKDGGRVQKATGGMVNYGKNGKITISESQVMSNAPRAQVKGFGSVRSDVKNFRKG